MLATLLGAAAARGEIIDRVVAVVGRKVITWSEVQREARLEAYWNGQPPPAPLRARDPQFRDVLERLIQQLLIMHEMEQSNFPPADEAQAKKRLEALGPVSASPAAYGLKQQDLTDYGKRLATTARFLELRFNSPDLRSKPGVARGPQQALDEVRGKIEQTLKEERDIDERLKDLRSRLGVRVLEPEQP